MTVVAMILFVASASCFDKSIDTISDLTCPIRYADKRQGYFLSTEENKAIIGTAVQDVKNPANDMPQAHGPIENCSSPASRCRSIAGLIFAIPKGTKHSAEYSDGPRMVIGRLANGGSRGSATCLMFTRTGCSPHVGVNKLVEDYQYDVSPAGVVTSVKIQNWNGAGELLSTQVELIKRV